MPLPKELDPQKCKNIIRNLNCTDTAELNHDSYIGSFTSFDRLSFPVEIEEKLAPFTVTKLNTVHTGVLAYQPNNNYWFTSTANSKPKCEDDAENLIDKDSWSLLIEEISLMIN